MEKDLQVFLAKAKLRKARVLAVASPSSEPSGTLVDRQPTLEYEAKSPSNHSEASEVAVPSSPGLEAASLMPCKRIVVKKIIGKKRAKEPSKGEERHMTPEYDMGGYSQWRETAWQDYGQSWRWPPYSDWTPSDYGSGGWRNPDYEASEPASTSKQSTASTVLSLSRASTQEILDIQDDLRRCNTGDQLQATFNEKLDAVADQKDKGTEGDVEMTRKKMAEMKLQELQKRIEQEEQEMELTKKKAEDLKKAEREETRKMEEALEAKRAEAAMKEAQAQEILARLTQKNAEEQLKKAEETQKMEEELADKKEEDLKKAEETRKMKELAKKEKDLKKAEKTRQMEELAKKKAEEDLKKAEEIRQMEELAKKKAEEDLKKAEETRQMEELAKKKAEEDLKKAEETRQIEELAKKKKEEDLKKAEETRKLDEELAKKAKELEELKKKAKQAREELAVAERRQDNTPEDSQTRTEATKEEGTQGEPLTHEDEERERKRLDAHARYMRYFRNIRNPSTPIELRKMGREAHGSKSLNSVLYDAWASCGEGNWTESKFLMKIRERHSTKKRGVRRWLTATEMNARFGEDLAEQIRNRKLLDKELKAKEVRAHPELPDNEDLRQFLTLVDEAEEEEHEESIDRLFSCLDASSSSSSSSSSSKSKGKKKKETKEKSTKSKKPGKLAKKTIKKDKEKKSKKEEPKEKKTKKTEKQVPVKVEEEDTNKEAEKKLAKDAKKAISDASGKLKWAISLLPNLSNMSEKYAASIRQDCDEKKDLLEVKRNALQKAIDENKVTQAMVDECCEARRGLETACEPLKGKKAKKA